MSWKTLSPKAQGLGPVTTNVNRSLGNRVRFNSNQYSTSDITLSFNSAFNDYYGKWETSNGVTADGFRSTPWHRSIQNCVSYSSPNFYMKASLTKDWWRQWHGTTSHRLLKPRTSYPGWNKSLKTYQAPSHLVESAKVKVMEQVAQRKFDLSESLAGALATYRMLDQSIGTVTLALMNLRKGNFAHAFRILGRPLKKRLKDPASAWVEFQYGVRPLVNDIVAGINLLQSQVDEASSKMLTASATSTETYKGKEWGFDFPTNTLGLIIPNKVLSEDNKASSRTEIRFRVDPNKSKSWTSVTFDNPFYFGWVATPWSFAVDWLIPVGDWLLAATANTGFVFVTGHTTHRLQIDSEVEGSTFFFTSDYYLSSTHQNVLPRMRNRVMVIQRDVHYSWPKPELYVNTSPFRSTQRLANAVALLAIQVRR